MPVDPNNPYVDTPHPKTMVDASYRYGCNSSKIGPGPRGMTRKTWVQDGWVMDPFGPDGRPTRVPRMVEIETKWNDLVCGHIPQAGLKPDPACAGCERRQW